MQRRKGIVIIGDSSIPSDTENSEKSGLPTIRNVNRTASTPPYSGREIDSIAALFGCDGATILSGRLARRDYVKATDFTG